MSGVLYVLGTPIGNLEDLSRRAARVLAEADLVVCEDTRHTGKLLQHLEIKKEMQAHHEHNEEAVVPDILERLQRGEGIALVTDAGTPGISDPGYRLVRAAREAGAQVEAVPGPSAVVAALSVSGLPTDAFLFVGFPPSRKGPRRTFLESLADEDRTLVLYEAPHRILRTLKEMAEIFGEGRPAFLAREMTKIHEEHLHATLGQLRDELETRGRIKGEITLVVGSPDEPARAASPVSPEVLATEVTRLETHGVPRKEALKEVARRHGVPKSAVWDAFHRGKEGD